MTSATLSSIVSRRLIPLARPLQIRRARAAAGRCLSASLDLALIARERLKIELELVRWDVRGDPKFSEHWAVWLGGGLVLDLTRVQVDGSRQLIGATSDYPANFTRPRRYPAALLLTAYQAHGREADRRLPTEFTRSRARALLRFDLARAWREHDPTAAVAALRQALRFACWGAFDATRRLLDRRRRTLLDRRRRLRAAADAASLPTPSTTTVVEPVGATVPHRRSG